MDATTSPWRGLAPKFPRSPLHSHLSKRAVSNRTVPGYAVLVENEALAALDACEYLFLSEIEELDHNGLRLVVTEGRRAGESKPIHVGDTVISGGTRIDITDESASFEVVWNNYVAYSVMNESFAAVDEQERYTGKRVRLYSTSHFKDYVGRASFACDEYPGPTQHVAVVCENHIVDVIAATAPVVQRLS
jgi:hypothetical protein